MSQRPCCTNDKATPPSRGEGGVSRRGMIEFASPALRLIESDQTLLCWPSRFFCSRSRFAWDTSGPLISDVLCLKGLFLTAGSVEGGPGGRPPRRFGWPYSIFGF